MVPPRIAKVLCSVQIWNKNKDGRSVPSKVLNSPNVHSQAASVSVSVSAQEGIVALGKAHTRSATSLSSLPKVALETVPIFA